MSRKKRWWVFAGERYYPNGGMLDFQNDYDIEQDAYEKAQTLNFDWYEIYDSEEDVSKTCEDYK